MKKYTPDEREAAIKELEAAELKLEEWEGPHETKVKYFRFVDDAPDKKKKGMLSGLVERIKVALHTA
jgi:hypothetical protein